MFSDFMYRLRAVFRRKSMERELAAELKFHLERETEKLVNAGMTRDEAQRRARLAIGGVEQVKEECREARGVAALESTIQDVHYGLRQLRRRPGFAVVVVTSLALGIGANTAIFTLIDAVLLRMLPIDDPAGLQLRDSASDEWQQPRVRVSGIPPASRREPGVRRRGRLRHRQAQRQPRSWRGQRRTDGRRTAGFGKLLSAPRRQRSGRAHHWPRRRREPEWPSGCGHQSRLLEAAVWTRTLCRRADDPPVGNAVHHHRCRPARVLRARGRTGAGHLGADHDAARGHAGCRELARRTHLADLLAHGCRTNEARIHATTGTGNRGRPGRAPAHVHEAVQSRRAPATHSRNSWGSAQRQPGSRACANSFRSRSSSSWPSSGSSS